MRRINEGSGMYVFWERNKREEEMMKREVFACLKSGEGKRGLIIT